MTPEGKIKKRLREKLKELKHRYIFMPVQSGLGASTLDYLCCIDGSFYGIETKKPGGKMTPRQRIIASEMEEAGGYAYLIDSVEALEQLLEDIGQRQMQRQIEQEILRQHRADHRKPSK